MRTHAHTPTHTHDHTDYTKLTLHNLKLLFFKCMSFAAFRREPAAQVPWPNPGPGGGAFVLRWSAQFGQLSAHSASVA